MDVIDILDAHYDFISWTIAPLAITPMFFAYERLFFAKAFFGVLQNNKKFVMQGR